MLQIVVVVGLLRKDMDDDAAVVQQHPALAVMPLGAQDLDALALQLELGLIGQSADMGGGHTRGNDEIFRNGGQVLHGQNVDIDGLLGVQRTGQTNGKFFAFHIVTLLV